MQRRPRTRGLRWYFDHNDGRLIDKWLHYFPVYERHMAPYRGRAITMLEIGVSQGGSLQMWRHHFGRKATIVGFDINPRVTQLEEKGIEIHVGDQSDPAFLVGLAARYGQFDIVLDDGSHVPEHQIISITHLWPHLKVGGIYIVEDLHTNYWPSWGGGRGRTDTFMAWLTERIDDMHGFHSEDGSFEPNDWTRSIGAIHVYDSMVVLEKAERPVPTSRMTGRPSFDDVYGLSEDEIIKADHRAQLASLNSPSARLRRLRRDPKGTLGRAMSRLRR